MFIFAELILFSKILNLKFDNLLRHYKTWGPSARTCIHLERGIETTASIGVAATSAAWTFVSDTASMLSSIAGLDASNVSHDLFALGPESPQKRDVPFGELATSHLQGFVIRAAAKLELVRQSQFFALISKHPWFKGFAGNFYEKFVHVRLTAHPSAKPLIGIPADSKLPQLVIPVCTQHIPLGGLSRLTKANEYELPFYWRPTNQSFTSINSILCTETEGILIQSTVSPEHDVKPEGIQSIRDYLPKGFWRKRKWAFVFITDTDENAVALRSQTLKDLPEGIDVYSCTFKIGWSKLTSRELAVLEEVMVIRYSMYMSIIIEGIFRAQRARCKTSKGWGVRKPRFPRTKRQTRNRNPLLKGATPRHA